MTVRVSSDVVAALSNERPVVALETAVLTAGLPKTHWNASYGAIPDGLVDGEPVHLALAKTMTDVVLEGGATPAWMCVLHGELVIGATQEELAALTQDKSNTKCSLSDIAAKMAHGQHAGTTVATTLLGCKHPSLPNPIRVFATGGIGGVHQNWNQELDVSADITALASTPTCVVSSGAKSILDLPATLQALETNGVPVVGLNTSTFPTFIERTPEDGMPIFHCQSVQDIATIATNHWHELHQQSALLAAVPLNSRNALSSGTLSAVMEDAERAFSDAGQDKTMRTPFLLDYLVKVTHGKSLTANIELLAQNARVATELACAL